MDKMRKLMLFCKDKGFVFAGSEIYGGAANTWDYGPLGVELKNNIKKEWWKYFVQERKDVVGFDPNIIAHPQIYKSANTLDNSISELLLCMGCHTRKRISNLESLKGEEFECSKCRCEKFEKIQDINLMFELDKVGPDGITTYLRPGSEQAVYSNFLYFNEVLKVPFPFGVATIPKVFRNEYVTGNFIFRVIEFEQLELLYFCDKKQISTVAEKFSRDAFNFLAERLGVSETNLRIEPCTRLPHYAKFVNDVEYNFCFGWGEICSTGDCGDYDLSLHEISSGKSMRHDGEIPNIAFISHGLDRVFLMTLYEAYAEHIVSDKVQIVLNLKPSIAPYKVAVLPFYKGNKKLVEKAQEIFDRLSKIFSVTFDSSQNVEKRYLRQDEIGTVFCVVIDFVTLEDGSLATRKRGESKTNRMCVDGLIDMVHIEC